QRERLEQALRQTKLAQMREADPNAALPPAAEVTISDDERPKLLAQLYRAWMVESERKRLGVGPSLQPDEMQSLLATRIEIADADLVVRARQRAGTVIRALTAAGIAADRLELRTPELAEATGEKPPARVQFSLP